MGEPCHGTDVSERVDGRGGGGSEGERFRAALLTRGYTAGREHREEGGEDKTKTHSPYTSLSG